MIEKSTYEIDAAMEADMAEITRIYAHHVLEGIASFEEVPPTAAELNRRRITAESQGYPFLVARNPQGVALGYAYAGPYRLRSAYRFTVEDSVYINPNYLKLGIGHALLNALILASEAAGFRQMVAVIGGEANQASIKLHQKLGFTIRGTLPAAGFKQGRWVDNILMQRPLGEGNSTPPH